MLYYIMFHYFNLLPFDIALLCFLILHYSTFDHIKVALCDVALFTVAFNVLLFYVALVAVALVVITIVIVALFIIVPL